MVAFIRKKCGDYEWLVRNSRLFLLPEFDSVNKYYQVFLKATENDNFKIHSLQMPKLDSVLLVEDDEITNFLSADVLRQMGVKKVDAATSGDHGLELLTKKCPDLILLDINMPLMNGFEFLDVKQKKNICSKAKVVMLTSSMMAGDLEKAKKYKDVVGFIEKPLTKEKMDAVLKKISKTQ